MTDIEKTDRQKKRGEDGGAAGDLGGSGESGTKAEKSGTKQDKVLWACSEQVRLAEIKYTFLDQNGKEIKAHDFIDLFNKGPKT